MPTATATTNTLTAAQFAAQGTTPAQIANIARVTGIGRLRAVADEVALATGYPGGYVRHHNQHVERMQRRRDRRAA